MTPRTCLATLAVCCALWPGLAAAQHACESTQTLSCPEGQSWDSTTQTCTLPAST